MAKSKKTKIIKIMNNSVETKKAEVRKNIENMFESATKKNSCFYISLQLRQAEHLQNNS